MSYLYSTFFPKMCPKISPSPLIPNNPVLSGTLGLTLRKEAGNTARNASNILIVGIVDTNVSLWVIAKRIRL